MAADGRPGEAIDWRLTTWDGAQREQMRRWSELPLEQMILALEEMQQISERLQSPDDAPEFRIHPR